MECDHADFQEQLENISRRGSMSVSQPVSPHSAGGLAPVSAFQGHQSQDLDKLAQIRITICPQGLSKVCSNCMIPAMWLAGGRIHACMHKCPGMEGAHNILHFRA